MSSRTAVHVAGIEGAAMDDQNEQQEMQELMFLCSGMMLRAAARKASMIQLELNPAQAIGLNVPEGSGRIMVVIAAGPSIPKLKQALDMVSPAH